MTGTPLAPAPAKPERKHRKRRILLLLLLAYLLYLLCGALVPFAFQPAVSADFQAAFDLGSFYGDGCPDRAALLADNVDALDARVRIINEAQERIIFTNFDIRDGESGRDIAAALLAAAKRGVDVKILVDGLNATFYTAPSPTFQALGRLPNVEFRFYNVPNPLMPWTFNGLMHDKYIIVDDRFLLIGGRNTFDKFLGDAWPDDRRTHDLDVLLYNTAAGTAEAGESVLFQIEDYFRTVWDGDHTSVHLEKPLFGGPADKAEAMLTARIADMANLRPQLFPETAVDYEALTVPLQKVTFIHNPTGILAKEPWVWWQVQQFMEHAQERVYLQTPYAVCNAPMYEGLARVAAKGIPFGMQVAATGIGDNFMASSDYTRNKGRVLDTGVTVYEWYGDYSTHGKSLLIDRDLALVGSYNLDMRSTYIDTEMMLVFHGEEFNALLADYLEEMEAQSLQAVDETAYVPKQGVEPWDNGDWKHALFPFTSVVFQLFRNLL